MTKNVIMPALGMAQETGVIVNWLKATGDAVRKGDPLMEVETDKAVMEVEAQHDGYLADLRFGAGDTVPVGEIVALLLPEAPAGHAAPAPPAPAPAPAPPPAPAPMPVQATAAPAPAAPAAAPPAAAVATPLRAAPSAAAPGRILASPKARRLAAERGLDLGRLAAAGYPQPYRAADLARLSALGLANGAAVNRMSASAPPENLAAFHALLQAQTGGLPDGALWSAFAAGALRPDRGRNPIVIRAETLPGAPSAAYRDPDLSPLADILPVEAGAAPDLILRDLTDTPLRELALASDATPILCIAAGYGLTLTWPEGSLSTDAALALIIGVARRIEQPLRHLL